MGLSLAVVAFPALHLARHGGECPGDPSFGIEGALGLLAQLLPGNIFHEFTSFR